MNKPSNFVKVAMIALIVGAVALFSSEILAFCGFYVARAETNLFNKASRVVLVRNENRTVLTMANDYQGELKDFAIVIPVPVVLEREQIHVTEPALLDHLDAYSAPRLVEYFDADPCRRVYYDDVRRTDVPTEEGTGGGADESNSLGVTVEARYTVGEYDILILSATESSGLESWLRQNGYRIPSGAGPVLASYLRQNLKFFVARVNLEEQSATGYTYLRPLQIAYESPRFMLPIRLGTVNANGPQELFVFALTQNGRVETTNYRTVRLPSGSELPAYIKNDFGRFYRAMFERQVERENMRAVFLEYAWDMRWCDPCAADPLSSTQLQELGVFWLNDGGGSAPPVFLTRLHLRYTASSFPDDLAFQETSDRTNFQGRYVIRHAYTGSSRCEAYDQYVRSLGPRRDAEAATLANLTGWPMSEIREHMGPMQTPAPTEPWWRRLWR